MKWLFRLWAIAIIFVPGSTRMFGVPIEVGFAGWFVLFFALPVYFGLRER